LYDRRKPPFQKKPGRAAKARPGPLFAYYFKNPDARIVLKNFDQIQNLTVQIAEYEVPVLIGAGLGDGARVSDGFPRPEQKHQRALECLFALIQNDTVDAALRLAVHMDRRFDLLAPGRLKIEFIVHVVCPSFER